MDQQPAQPVVTPQTPGSKNPLVIILVIMLVIIVGAGAFLFLRSQGKEEPKQKVVTGLARDSITIALPMAVKVFPDSDPEFFSNYFNNNIFDGLGRIVGGQVKGALTTSWSNPDKNTWRFKLRKGVKFHNGDDFTAADVKFSINQALENDWPNAFNLGTIESVTVVDDFTVDIKTTSPDPILLNRLVYAFIVSEKQFKEKGDKPAVGTGPYELVSLDGEKGVLAANEEYYLGMPKVKKVTYKILPDDVNDEQIVELFNKGEIDVVRLADKETAKSIQGDYQIKSLADPFITFLWLDTARDKSPYVDKTPNPLKNKLVRQAIYKTINVNNPIKQASLSAIPASQLVTNAIFGYNPAITRPEQNIEEAKKLMIQAGVGDGFSLTLDISSGETQEKEGNAIAEELKKINIKVKLTEVSDEQVFDKLIIEKDTSAFVIDYGAETFDSGEIFTVLLRTQEDPKGTDNITNYSNPEIDKLADEISTTFDPINRQKKLQGAMVKAMEEVPMLPLYNREVFYIVRDNFDWTPSAFGAIYGAEVSGRQVVTE